MHYSHGSRTLQVPLVVYLIFSLFLSLTPLLSGLGVKELNRQTDNLIICDDSLVLISNFTSVFIRTICSIFWWMFSIEVSSSLHFIFEKTWYQLIHNVLQSFVRPNIEKRFCFVDLDITYGTVFTRRQVADNAHFTKWMQAFYDCGCIDEISTA